jgi:hypothetical protein
MFLRNFGVALCGHVRKYAHLQFTLFCALIVDNRGGLFHRQEVIK